MTNLNKAELQEGHSRELLYAAMSDCQDRDAIDAIRQRLSTDENLWDQAGDAFQFAMVGRRRLLKREKCNMQQPSTDWVEKSKMLGLSGDLNQYLESHPIYKTER